MSRYKVPALNRDHEAVIGWDGPLGTYFFQVFDTTIPDDDPRDDCLLWLGAEEGAFPCLDALLPIVGDYARVPEETLAQLRADQAQPYTRSPLQERVLCLVREVRVRR